MPPRWRPPARSRRRAPTPSAPPSACSTSRRSATRGPASAEAVEQQKLLGSANQIEAVRANLEQRAPRFADAG